MLPPKCQSREHTLPPCGQSREHTLPPRPIAIFYLRGQSRENILPRRPIAGDAARAGGRACGPEGGEGEGGAERGEAAGTAGRGEGGGHGGRGQSRAAAEAQRGADALRGGDG
eukprot:1185848-Prorocentrum_minimum.AAC.2